MLFLNSMKLIVTSLAGTIGISSLELEWEACLHFLLLGALFQWICVLYVCRDPSEVEVQLQEKKEKKDHEQGGKKFIQLEGAIGSCILNLDRYFRTKFKKKVVRLLNLEKENREKFFLPIKKFSDFEELISKYDVDLKTGRLSLK